jgi:uncharacterized phage-like protein YoqJ
MQVKDIREACIVKVCTFFGHSDCPESVYFILRAKIEELIKNTDVSCFYVGNNGRFDSLAAKALRELQNDYLHIRYSVVLAYLPEENTENSIFPEGLESVPKRFCIDKRNRWMLDKADYVICYVTRNIGGAARFSALARKKNKTVINIALQQ